MNGMTGILTRILVAMALCGAAARGFAQDAKLQLDSLNKLSEKAAKVTDLTLDGSLLQFAVKLIESDEGDEDVKEIKPILLGLKGIYIKSFEFDEASQYSKADVEAVRSQLSAPRWAKIVQSVDRRRNEHNEIYLLKDGERVGGIVILVAEPRELTVVNIVGNVPLDKISAVQHHFTSGEKDSSKPSAPKKESSHNEE